VNALLGALDSNAVIIPVGETLQGSQSVALPHQVLVPLVEQSDVRFILNQCVCRVGEGCQEYPLDLGCLFLGDGASALHPTMGNRVTVSQALDHIRLAMDLGLAPMVVQSAFDSWMFGVPYRRTLGICFCCDCCCAVRRGLRDGPPGFSDQVQRLPGITVDVGPECVGCGLCVEACYVQAISIRDGRAAIEGECKGCGRCVTACPTRAITLRVNHESGELEEFIAHMQKHVSAN